MNMFTQTQNMFTQNLEYKYVYLEPRIRICLLRTQKMNMFTQNLENEYVYSEPIEYKYVYSDSEHVYLEPRI